MNTLKSTSSLSKKKRVGRGGDRGKTSGRGHKGQRQHGDHGVRPEVRDLIKSLPKRRGYGKNRGRTHVYKPEVLVVNVATLENTFDAGATISPLTLEGKGLVSSVHQVSRRGIKILGNGELTKKFTIAGCVVSDTARTKIEKAGGSITNEQKK